MTKIFPGVAIYKQTSERAQSVAILKSTGYHVLTPICKIPLLPISHEEQWEELNTKDQWILPLACEGHSLSFEISDLYATE